MVRARIAVSVFGMVGGREPLEMPLSAGEAGGMGKVSKARDSRLDRTATAEVSGIDREKTTQPNESGWVKES